jgi:hypothetical protein
VWVGGWSERVERIERILHKKVPDGSSVFDARSSVVFY